MFIAMSISAFIGFFGLLIFVNVLGVKGIGKFYVLIAIVNVLESFSVGIGKGAEHYIGQYSDERQSQYGSAGIIISVLFSVSVSVVLLAVYLYGPNIDLVQITFTTAIFVSILIFTSSLRGISKRIYGGIGYPAKSEFIQAGGDIMQKILQIVLVTVFNFGVLGLILGTILETAIISGYILLVVRPINYSLPSTEYVRDLTTYVIWSSTGDLIRSIRLQIDTLIIALILGTSSVGIYRFVLRVSTPVSFPASSIRRSLFVRTSQRTDSSDGVTKTLDRIGGYATILSVPMVAGSAVIGFELLQLVYTGDELSEGYLVLVGAAIYKSIKGQSQVLSGFLNGSEKPNTVLISEQANILILVIVGTALTYLIGINGMILGVIASSVIQIGVLYAYTYRTTNELYNPSKQLIYQAISTISMLIVILPIKLITEQYGITYQVVSVILIGSIVYAAVMVALDDRIQSYVSERLPYDD